MYNLKAEHHAVIQLRSQSFNIDNGSGTTIDEILASLPFAVKILDARVIYDEATDTSGVASANVKIGTAAGGAQIVAATALEVLKSVGDTLGLTLVEDEFAAGTEFFVRHTGIAATEAGKYTVQLWCALL